MNNLFIVNSPFQLVSAIEAKNYFKEAGSCLIVVYSLSKEENNNSQLLDMLIFDDWDEILEVRPLLSPKETNIRLLILLRKLKDKSLDFDRIFIGEYRSFYQKLFFDVLNPKECFLLDDGNIVIELQKKYLPTGIGYSLDVGIKKNIKFIIEKFIFISFGLHARTIRRDINLFTCFDLEPHNECQKIIKNDFKYLRKKQVCKEIIYSEIYFLGGNISGCGLLDESLELELLRKIKIYYCKQNKKLVYIPHRRELQQKLYEIENSLGIGIIYFDNPAEIEFIYMNNIPFGIASFCSTALFTLSKMFSFNSVKAFYLDMDKMPVFYREEIIEVYSEYKKHLEVVELHDYV